MINRRGAEPLYLQVADALRDRITTSEFQPGQRLPAEPDLAHAYQVGKDTIRDALAVLKGEGLIVTRRGYRALVVEPVERQAVRPEPGSRVIVRMPDRHERRSLGIDEGVPVFVLVDAQGAGDIYPADRFELALGDAATGVDAG